MDKNNKLSSFIDIRNISFFEVGIGITANTTFVFFHIHTFLLKHRLKPTDLLNGNLALIHIVMLLTMGFMATDIFGSQKIWDDIKCKSVISLYKLMRGLSICTTCLLSVTQAITLSSRSSCLAKLKHKSSHHNLYCIPILWIFNMTISGYFLISVIATPNVTALHLLFVTESCSLSPMSYFLGYICFALATFQDVFLMGLTALSSGYMVVLLYGHKRQSQHLHSTNLSPKASPEERATHTILLLMSFFVVTYFWDCIFSSSSTMMWNNDPVHLCLQMLLGNGYATISPLVLINRKKPQIIRVLKSTWVEQQ
ncbi:vomeronasal type-1 receptor 90-like [Equus quagga]|uniref:vomeronasal type-1 receptor 90-like n=1 Tax=Equus quagga TaxID=89248 RepID=UPI001EE1E7BF|nr:vomeronasal type-1 receptor 90-like [Equus quagga]